MTKNSLLALLSLLLVTALTAPLISGAAQEPEHSDAAQEPEHHAGEHDEVETPMGEKMEVIKKAMRRLRRGLGEAEKLPAALPLILSMQEAAHFCKTEIPVMAETIEGKEEHAAFVKRYRLGMIQFQGGLLKLEEAVLNGDMEAAQKIYRGLKDAAEIGHEEFTDE